MPDWELKTDLTLLRQLGLVETAGYACGARWSAAKHYDQIAWFMGDLSLLYAKRAGVVDFTGAVFKELTARQVTDRMSDHFPLWVEFVTDRSPEALARTLGLNPDAPDPFASIPD